MFGGVHPPHMLPPNPFKGFAIRSLVRSFFAVALQRMIHVVTDGCPRVWRYLLVRTILRRFSPHLTLHFVMHELVAAGNRARESSRFQGAGAKFVLCRRGILYPLSC